MHSCFAHVCFYLTIPVYRDFVISNKCKELLLNPINMLSISGLIYKSGPYILSKIQNAPKGQSKKIGRVDNYLLK